VTEQPIENVFARSWALLTRNWIIIVPGLVVGLAVGIIGQLLAPPAYVDADAGVIVTGGSFLGNMTRGLVGFALSILAFIANQAFTTGMAGAAWERGTATLADGAASFQEDAGRIVVTALGLIVLGAAALLLAPFTLGLSFLALLVFALYSFPAAIVGNRPGFSSIAESFAIARARFVPTLIVAVLICAIFFVVALLAGLLTFAPLIGPILSGCITQAFAAYATLVVVGEYLNFRGPGLASARAGGPPPYAPPPASSYTPTTPTPTPPPASYTPPPPPPPADPL
jgi:hypothetical protein